MYPGSEQAVPEIVPPPLLLFYLYDASIVPQLITDGHNLKTWSAKIPFSESETYKYFKQFFYTSVSALSLVIHPSNCSVTTQSVFTPSSLTDICLSFSFSGLRPHSYTERQSCHYCLTIAEEFSTKLENKKASSTLHRICPPSRICSCARGGGDKESNDWKYRSVGVKHIIASSALLHLKKAERNLS